MFAVPGWSVPTSELKRQTEHEPQPKAQDLEQEAPSSNSNERKEKWPMLPLKQTKRKRPTDLANVEELWKQHVEPQNASKQEAKKEKAKKRKLEKKEVIRKEKAEQNAAKKDEAGKQDAKKQNTEKHKDPKDETTGVGTATPSKSTEPSKTPENQQTGPKLSKKESKAQKAKSKQNQSNPEQKSEQGNKDDKQPPPPAPPAATTAKLTPLQQAMRQKLLGARFRYLNEQLYTKPSSQALELFSSNPEFFAEYHSGFTRQVQESWPSNPVDGYISQIQQRARVQPFSNRNKKQSTDGAQQVTEALPRRQSKMCGIADLGCGDAKLAHALEPLSKKLRLKFYSYDLHSSDPLVTKADVAKLPLPDGAVDVAIFCLSLMGTNWVSFVEEAWRILRGDGKGECWVSEVKSRFGKGSRPSEPSEPPVDKKKNKNGNKKKKSQENDEDENDDDANIFAEDAAAGPNGDDTDISAFVAVFRSRGFALKEQSVDKSNKMFVKMEFVKHGAPTKGKHAGVAGSQAGKVKKFIEKDPAIGGMNPEEESQVLKPCVYKKR